jgi:AraC-like DNA-binding protein
MGKAYGNTIGEYFGATRSPLVVHSMALDDHIAATYLRSDGAGTGMTDPIPPEPALLVAVQLRPLLQHELWIDGHRWPAPAYAPGAVTILDLRSRPVANLVSDYECVQLYFPRSALDRIADNEQCARLGDMPVLTEIDDPILAGIGRLAAMAVTAPRPVSSLMLESILLAAHRHILQHHAGNVSDDLAANKTGLLSQLQQQQVMEYIEAHLETSISLQSLATLCGLSVSYFSRAFKASLGSSPHRWLTQRRLARARLMLADGQLPLAAIAAACGFHDQSHLSRTLRRAEGLPPAAWQRHLRDDPET